VSDFSRLTVVGVGMIGASLARAVRRARPGMEILGYDPAPPAAGVDAGVDRWSDTLEEALGQADLVVLAAPVSSILELLPRAASLCPARALVTDTGSTKEDVCRIAAEVFRAAGGPHFLGGHPMAGSERGGARSSDPDLLRGAPYALCPDEQVPPAKTRALERLLRDLGARPVWLAPREHDRMVARVSHLAQMLAVALGSLLEEGAARDARLPALAGPGLRDLLRLASSSYPLWRDICRTNAPALREAIRDLARRLEDVAQDLDSERLEHWFAAARRFREQRLKVDP